MPCDYESVFIIIYDRALAVLCELCGKGEAIYECSECGAKICDDCTKEVSYEEYHPGIE